MPDPLFRQEVIDARAAQWLGSIRIAQPLGDSAAACIALIVIASIAAFAVFGTYTRRATVPGLLQPAGGTVRISAPATGAILSIAVVEGQRVAAGERLVVLSGERLSTTGATQALIGTQLDARRAALDRELVLAEARHASRVRVTRERLASIDVERLRLAQESDVNDARRRIAQAAVDRFEALARTGFVSLAQVQAKTDDVLILDAQAAGLRRVDANLVRERQGLVAQLEDSRLQSAGERADAERAIALLEQERTENDARRTTVVVAPNDGTVTGISARAGAVVGAGGLLATLIPEGVALDGELYASTRQAGFVERGQRVRLRYAAYPFQKYGMGEGVVESVEQSPYALQDLPTQVAATLGLHASSAAEPVYRIVVKVDAQSVNADGRERTLRPGMVFEADVIQDRRRLIEWLLEPVYGFAARR